MITGTMSRASFSSPWSSATTTSSLLEENTALCVLCVYRCVVCASVCCVCACVCACVCVSVRVCCVCVCVCVCCVCVSVCVGMGVGVCVSVVKQNTFQ